ncbi:glycosyltransferase [Sansalvadorimonas sp. 2012CJ34-2]|uniref:Glycosyltransferase n=1 Tax=Parendozoicomonas callyspongiae TaxID=2942213 RepID=A0ABT0PD99_9GAMM|nr:glycosyltransferase family 4 protein [Sansalvadorimonas sp. 2012CJ34-2]MCL6269006.1 glycosyltransferase [Sansalvadorimonas sp. 2012CJ34-2]
MATFGTVLPSDSDVLDGYINGLREANSGFLEALVRYSTIFDHFIFFCGDGDCQSRQEAWNSWLKDKAIKEKTVSVFPLQHLPAAVASHLFDLFYSGDPYISYLLELRDAFAEKAFPVVGRAHALSQDITLGAWRSLIHSPSLECDALLASSQASVGVVERLLEEAGRRIDGAFSGQLIQIPLGIDIPEEMSDKKSARESLGLPADGIILFCIGRLSPVDKADLHPLLLALADLYDHECVHDTYLYICGQSDSDDDYVLSLVNLAGQLGIDDRVLFNFDLFSEQKPLAYRASDIFVSLADSVQESFGIAPVEAMAAELPVVLSDWDGYRELIESGEHGYLIPTQWGRVDGLSAPGAFFESQKAHLVQAQAVAIDIQDLTGRLNELIKKSTVRQRMGSKAAERAKRKYCWSKVVSQFDTCAEGLIERSEHLVICPSKKLHSLHFGRIFSGYSTTLLSEQDNFHTTLYGRQALAGMVLPARFEALESAVPEELLNELLRQCCQPCTIEELRESLNVARVQVDSTVLWASKHGLIVKKEGVVRPSVAERFRSTVSPEKLIKSAVPNSEVVEDVTELEEQLKEVLLAEERRVLSLAQINSEPLVLRYISRRMIANTRAFRLILQRLSEHHASIREELFLEKNKVAAVCPITDQGYLGTCQITLGNGDHLVYKPTSGVAARTMNSAGGLFDRFNCWIGRSHISFNQNIYCGSDCKGDFSLRLFNEEMGLSSDRHLHDLGLFSAFVLFAGMSDIHLKNLKVGEDGIFPVDLDMVCHPEILNQLHNELCQSELPARWQDSSLALTGIETLWDKLFDQGWMLDEDGIEAVISGFEHGLLKMAENSTEWKALMLPLTSELCRDDLVPFNSAAPILSQLERFDLSAMPDINGLKSVLAAQARRVVRQLGVDGGDESLVVQLVKNWIKGQHFSDWIKPGKDTERVIREISNHLMEHDGVSISWLSTLYRGWLLERNGLPE